MRASYSATCAALSPAPSKTAPAGLRRRKAERYSWTRSANFPRTCKPSCCGFCRKRRYERIGDDRTRQADVRFIGATNRDLTKAIAAGRFREDLYYRLHVFPIHIAPLRERKEDIPLLANHFIEVSVRDLKCAKPRLTRAAVTELLNYDWPGNVRELRNVIDRAVILARGGALRFNLPLTGTPTRHSPRLARQAQVQEGSDATAKLLTEVEVRALERDNLLAALEATNWRIGGPDGAAELLGVKPTHPACAHEEMGTQEARGRPLASRGGPIRIHRALGNRAMFSKPGGAGRAHGQRPRPG